MDARLIILGPCNCGQCLTMDQMIDTTTAKCFNCNTEFHIHIDMEPLLTIEEWEQQYAGKEIEATDECLFLPF